MNAFKQVCRELATVIIGGLIAIFMAVNINNWYQNKLFMNCVDHPEKTVCKIFVPDAD